MNASQLTTIREAKQLLIDCSCFRGPQGDTGATGPQGSTIVGPQGPIGPSGSISDFTIPGASTNALMYYTGSGFGAMSSLLRTLVPALRFALFGLLLPRLLAGRGPCGMGLLLHCSFYPSPNRDQSYFRTQHCADTS